MKNLLENIPTNINYDNNYNYNNNNNYNNDLTTSNNTNHSRSSPSSDDDYEIAKLTASMPLGQEKENIVSQNEGFRKLPGAWKYLKLDLYLNGTLKGGLPSYKLKAWISPKAAPEMSLVSLLNTPWESGRMKYNVDDEAWNTDFHWKCVRNRYHKIKDLYDDVRSSKLAKTHKGAPTPVAVFLYKDRQDYGIDLIIKGEVYQYWLETELTDKQKATNQVATLKIGNKQRKMLEWSDLGL